MSDIIGAVGELRATIHIIRKATGVVDTFELIGVLTPEQATALGATVRHNRNHGVRGAVVGPGTVVSNQEK